MNVSASLVCTNNTVAVNWQHSPDAFSYEVMATGRDGNVKNCTTNDTSCHLTDMQCAQNYTITVTPFSKHCKGLDSYPLSYVTGKVEFQNDKLWREHRICLTQMAPCHFIFWHYRWTYSNTVIHSLKKVRKLIINLLSFLTVCVIVVIWHWLKLWAITYFIRVYNVLNIWFSFPCHCYHSPSILLLLLIICWDHMLSPIKVFLINLSFYLF